MSERAAVLAARFAALNDGLLAALTELPEERWRSARGAEGWSIGVVVCHVAAGHGLMVGRMRQMLAGASVDAIDDPDGYNAARAAEYALVVPVDALDRLRREGAAAAAFVRGLSDAQLDATALVSASGRSFPIEAYVTHALIGHLEGHRASVLAVLGR